MPESLSLRAALILDAATVAVFVLIAIGMTEEFMQGVIIGLMVVPISRAIVRDLRRWKTERDA